MKGQYVIINLKTMDFMKDENNKMCYYDTEEEASDVCGIFEFKDVWIMQLIFNYKEN